MRGLGVFMSTYLQFTALLFEFIGTAWLLLVVLKAQRLAKHELNSMDTLGPVGNAIRDTLAGRFRNQWPGFGFLIMGLIVESVSIYLR
jgi:hypothetical protein